MISDAKRAELDAVAALRAGGMGEQTTRPPMSERHFEHEVLRRLDQIEKLLLARQAQAITSFTAESNMPFQAGATAVIDFTPVPAGATPVTPPTISSSDPVNAPVTADSTGLIATVVFPATATVGESVTISIAYTNPDGVVANGSYVGSIIAAPAPDVTGFTATLAS